MKKPRGAEAIARQRRHATRKRNQYSGNTQGLKTGVVRTSSRPSGFAAFAETKADTLFTLNRNPVRVN